MYNKFYGFSEKPFEITPDPKFFHLTSSHRNALQAMIKSIENRQRFISITGEVGTGKTSLIYYFLTSLDDRVKTAFIFNPSITFEELLEIILRERYIEVTEKDKNTLLQHLAEYLSHIGNDETLAVIIDEAQHLSQDILLELEKLYDFAPQVPERLQIIFVGQPEFKNTLNLPSLKIINQQITVKRELSTLTDNESREYIEHRLKHVGSSAGQIFTPDAISSVIQHAKGIPRVINIVCDNALLSGFSQSRKKIDVKIIRDVIKNLEGPALPKFKSGSILKTGRETPGSHPERIIPYRKVAAFFLLLLGLSGIIFLAFGFLQYGPDKLLNITSKWTSFLNNKQSQVTTSDKTAKTSSIGDDGLSPEARELPPASAQTAVPVSTSPMRAKKEPPLLESVKVKTGESISILAKQYYGRSNITRCDLILSANPDITNANIVSVNQNVRIPKITESSLIVQSSDRTYKIHVGTFQSPKFAGIYRNNPSLTGKEIEIVTHQAAPGETWYRVLVGKFNNEEESMKMLSILKDKKLLPLFETKTQ
jgi:general secretion pathway protein A